MTLTQCTDSPDNACLSGDGKSIQADLSGYKEALQDLERRNEKFQERVERQGLALRQQAAELEAVVSLSTALRQAATVEEVIEISLKAAVQTLGADSGAGFLLEERSLLVAALDGVSGGLQARYSLPREDNLWPGMETGRPFLLEPGLRRRSAAGLVCQNLALDTATVAMVPLQAARETVALLALAFAEPRSFDEIERPLTAIAEIGGSALQRVRTTNALERTIRARMRDLAALYEATAMTTLHLDTPIILERMVDKALEVVGGDAGIIHLLAQDREPPELTIACAIPSWLIDWLQAHDLGHALWERVFEEEKSVIIADWPSLVPSAHSPYLERFPAYIGEPIRAAGCTVGVLSVFGEAIQEFSAEDIALLVAIADHVGTAIESAWLRRRAGEAAVMEERQRLARDMHDSVTQSLYSLNLFAEAAQDSSRAGDLAQTRHYLQRLSATGQQALKDMRLLIYELHPLASVGGGLVGALQQRLEAVERRAGVEAQIVTGPPLALSRRIETGLYRIAQEALNNALKHANASRVVVRIGAEGEGVYLEVEDDGRGFDLDGLEGHAGLGLTSIRERAEELGGAVQVSSTPGAGTVVRVVVSLADGSDAHDLEAGL